MPLASDLALMRSHRKSAAPVAANTAEYFFLDVPYCFRGMPKASSDKLFRYSSLRIWGSEVRILPGAPATSGNQTEIQPRGSDPVTWPWP
jgi:hypothetical protein